MNKHRRVRMHRMLRSVMADQQLVRVRRRIRGADTLEGYVVGFDEDCGWLLLAVFDPKVTLDGWVALRQRDVRSVKPRPRHIADFVRRALQLHGEWPPSAPDGVELTGTRALLASAGARYPLVTLNVEYTNLSVVYVGAVCGFGKRTVRLREITPGAEWEKDQSSWKRRKISRVDLGGCYEHALFDVAGPAPPADDD